MADTDTQDPRNSEDTRGFAATEALPLLPLSSGAVLPQMVVTLALETDEARRAGAAARAAGGRVVLVPRVDGRYARVGVVAQVEDAGALPSGVAALVVRGMYRASIVDGQSRSSSP